MASLKAQRDCVSRKRKKSSLINWPCFCAALEQRYAKGSGSEADSVEGSFENVTIYMASKWQFHSDGSNSYRSSDSSNLNCSRDTVDNSPSSNISFDMMKSSNEKTRKEKVKEYLKELKTMVNHEKPKGSRVGTLSTLEHVVNSMRKIKAKQMEAEIKSQTQFTDIESGFYSGYTTPVEGSTSTLPFEQHEQLVFVLSPRAGIIENISPNVKTVLGYPWDSLLGRPLSDFIGYKDQAVLGKLTSLDKVAIEKAENGNSSIEDDPTINNRQKIYLSLRMYKSLEHGFRIHPGNHFLPFEVKYCVRNLCKEDSLSGLIGGSIPPAQISTGKQTCIILKCTPLKTVYKGPQCVPEVRSFTTRHDHLFNATKMHPNAIPLLGYLPQEFVNSSIFDYYHSDDLPELYNTYQTLVKTEGKPLKSKPYRLRVKNGDYILVDTEWSAIMKPKSHEVKAVICQHTVMRGPNNPDVFEVKQMFHKPEPNIAHVNKLREKIKKVFSQNSDRVKLESNAIFSLEKMPDSVSEFQVPGQVGTPSQEGPSSRTVFESSQTYEHLNYKTSIRRFLLSQPKTYSSQESEKKSSDSHQDYTTDLANELIEAFPVDFAIPKPPSFGSSIKVLVSEQEPREDLPMASPNREEMEESPAILMEASSSESEPQPAYLPVTLTQDMLRAHTKMQEKLYVQQATKDNTNIPSSFRPMHSNTSQGHKRFHAPEQDGTAESNLHAAKAPRTIKPIHGINPGFQPMEIFQGMPDQLRTCSFPGEKLPDTMTSELVNFVRMYRNNFGAAFPYVQVNSLNHVNLPNTNATNGSGVQWPYYSNQDNSGLPYLPLYTPVPLFKRCTKAVYTQATPGKHGKCAQHMASRIAQTTTSSSSVSSFQPKYERKKLQPTRMQLVAQAHQKKGKDSWESSDNTSSVEDTTSSSIYLLESDSYNNSSCQDEQDPSTSKHQHRLPETSPWLHKTKWTRDTEMRYTMPKRKLARVMKEDREKLSGMSQENLVCQQLHECLEEIDNPNSSPAIDEEVEAILMPQEAGEDVEKLMAGFTEIIMDEQGICGGCDPEHNHGVSKMVIPKKMKGQNKVTKYSSEDCDSDMTMKGPEEKLDDLSTSVIVGSAIPYKSSDSGDVDSTISKDSGNLTPSDIRSNEEAPSSLKESDSKEESDASSRDQKDGEIFSPYPEIHFLERLFVPLKLNFPEVCTFSKRSQLPRWLLETNFNKDIEVKYQLKERSREEVLENDKKISDEMTQPAPVIAQFEDHMNEVKQGKLNSAKFWSTPNEKPTMSEMSDVAEISDTEPCKKKLRNVIVTELMGAMMKQLDFAGDASRMDTSPNVTNNASDTTDMVDIKTENLSPMSQKSPKLPLDPNKESQQCGHLNEQLMNCQTSAMQCESDSGNEMVGNFDEMFLQMFQPATTGDLYDSEMGLVDS